MKSEFRANHESEPNFEEYNSELRQKLTDLGNFLTMAPIESPHRNVLRAAVSAVMHLTSELGTEKSRIQEFKAKIDETLELLRSTS